MLEYALLLPLLLVMVLAIIEFSFIVWSYDTIANAAREGARVGIIRASLEEDILDAVLERAVGLYLSPDDVTITREEIELGAEVQVAVDYDYSLLISVIGGGHTTLHMHTVATMHME